MGLLKKLRGALVELKNDAEEDHKRLKNIESLCERILAEVDDELEEPPEPPPA